MRNLPQRTNDGAQRLGHDLLDVRGSRVDVDGSRLGNAKLFPKTQVLERDAKHRVARLEPTAAGGLHGSDHLVKGLANLWRELGVGLLKVR